MTFQYKANGIVKNFTLSKNEENMYNSYRIVNMIGKTLKKPLTGQIYLLHAYLTEGGVKVNSLRNEKGRPWKSSIQNENGKIVITGESGRKYEIKDIIPGTFHYLANGEIKNFTLSNNEIRRYSKYSVRNDKTNRLIKPLLGQIYLLYAYYLEGGGKVNSLTNEKGRPWKSSIDSTSGKLVITGQSGGRYEVKRNVMNNNEIAFNPPWQKKK